MPPCAPRQGAVSQGSGPAVLSRPAATSERAPSARGASGASGAWPAKDRRPGSKVEPLTEACTSMLRLPARPRPEAPARAARPLGCPRSASSAHPGRSADSTPKVAPPCPSPVSGSRPVPGSSPGRRRGDRPRSDRSPPSPSPLLVSGRGDGVFDGGRVECPTMTS